jgi:hypothetical protein
MITVIGEFFNKIESFGEQEHSIFNSVKRQIENKFPNSNNLIINTTWLGPQFNNQSWPCIQALIDNNQKFDNLFWTGIVDPIAILPGQLKEIEQLLCLKEVFYIGVSFEGPYSFNTHSIVCQEEFPKYTDDDLKLRDLKFLYLNYNRKPKPFRIMLVEKLHKHSLDKYGIVSLGKPELNYDVSQGLSTDKYYTIHDKSDPTNNGRFPAVRTFGGVPADFCSLGDLSTWQTHFLNVVSETEFYPWDTVFVTEKTWKPIIGMRPFIINGQTTVYFWLRDHGFRTFNHYWPHIEMENIAEYEVHDSIVAVLKFLSALDKKQLLDMYQSMLPDLLHNRDRFFDFAQEQQYKIDNLFE